MNEPPPSDADIDVVDLAPFNDIDTRTWRSPSSKISSPTKAAGRPYPAAKLADLIQSTTATDKD